MNVKWKLISIFKHYYLKQKKTEYRKNWDNKVDDLLLKHDSKLTVEQKGLICDTWKKYDIINVNWADYYYSCNGIFSTKYIPSDIYFGKICRKLNRREKFPYPLFQDKNYLDCFFTDVMRPEVLIRNVNGQYLDVDYQKISKDDLRQVCACEAELVIKPTIDTTGARNVKFLNTKGKDFLEQFECTLNEAGIDFVIQKVLKQHPSLAQLNEDSINTVRVLSLLWEGEVIILGAITRIGVKGIRVDNLVASNGVSCGIDDDGFLYKIGYDKFGNAVRTLPNGILLNGHKIEGFTNIIKKIKREHFRIPHFRLIGWDFTLTEAEEPVLIEANLDFPEIEFHQLAKGPLLGEDELFEKIITFSFE